MLAVKAWAACARLRCNFQLTRSAQTAAVARRDDYASLTDADVKYFESVLGARGVITDVDALQPLNK